jgi:hypothetical protein
VLPKTEREQPITSSNMTSKLMSMIMMELFIAIELAIDFNNQIMHGKDKAPMIALVVCLLA